MSWIFLSNFDRLVSEMVQIISLFQLVFMMNSLDVLTFTDTWDGHGLIDSSNCSWLGGEWDYNKSS